MSENNLDKRVQDRADAMVERARRLGPVQRNLLEAGLDSLEENADAGKGLSKR